MTWARQPKYVQYLWFIIDGWLRWDVDGWELMLRTPLLGGVVSKNWPSMIKIGRTSRVWLGFVARWPVMDGGIIYMWNWEREYAFTSFYDEVADGNLDD